jgi:ribosomal protein S18 acetylase RimI-like enzyme/predicted O-methyltransferase YrrM
MQRDPSQDVPSRIDLRRTEDAREWADTAMRKRPWRMEFFQQVVATFVKAGVERGTVLELGSGPGFLAHHVLTMLPNIAYVALDFSRAMHALARERLGDLVNRVRFVEADFRHPGWDEGLGLFDAVATVQAVHELRHKRHAPALYSAVKNLLKPGGLLLVCDHVVGPGAMSDAALYMTLEEHEAALRDVGFLNTRLLQHGGLVLYEALAGGSPGVITPYDPSVQGTLESFFEDVWRDSRFPFDPSRAHADLRQIATEYQSRGGGFWLVRVEGRIVGTVAVRRLPNNTAEIKRLNVRKEYRAQGIGASLLRHAIRNATEKGFAKVRLDTIRNTGPAVRLFQRHGFVEIPRYNDNPDANLFMELVLR